MKGLVHKIFKNPEIGVLIPLVLIIAGFSLNEPDFLTPNNVSAILRSLAFVGIIAIGQTLIILVAEIDISVGSVAGLGAIIAAQLMTAAELFVPVAILLALLACALVGLVNGVLVNQARIPSFIATIGMLYIAKGVTYLICHGNPIYPLPSSIEKLSMQEPFGTSWPFVLFIVLILVGDQMLRRTVAGRKLYATGGNAEVAKLAGINTILVKTGAFVACSTLAGLAGILQMFQLNTGQPTIGLGWELMVIASTVVGGVSLLGGSGTILGTLIGVLILYSVQNGLNFLNVNTHWETVAIGMIMILAVLVDMLRRGRYASLARFWDLVNQRIKK